MSTEASLADAAGESELVRRVRAFVDWVGAGRKLTQTGRDVQVGEPPADRLGSGSGETVSR